MQMIEVMKRLAELDDANGGVKESTKLVNDPSVALITESQVAECGPMGMPGMPGMPSNTPASFSINASAGSGDEVASMLTQIMTLAGVKSHGAPMGGDKPLTGEPPMGGGDDIKAALSAIDQVEDEEAALGGMSDIGNDEIADMGGMDAEMGTAGPAGGDVGAMADQVRDMADELAGKDKEDLGLESMRQFDNSPQEQVRSYNPNDFAHVLNKIRDFEQVPARSGDNPLKAESVEAQETAVQEGNEPTSLLDITNNLFKEYQAYKAQ